MSTLRAQTVLGSVRLNGQTTHTTYTGGTTGQRFLEYLKDILIPTLHKGDIVVMDNIWKCRTAELLPKTVSRALLCVSQQDCVGWFKADGYCL